MDQLTIATNLASLLSLIVVIVVGLRTVRAFQQSKRALVESASLLNVIVDALSSRIQRSEAALAALRSEMAVVSRQSDALEEERASLHTTQEQVIRQLEDVLSTDKRLITDLEQFKSRLSELETRRPRTEDLPKRENVSAVIPDGDILSALTPTERKTLEILRIEGTKGAPELGKLLGKSREHTSRLMRKLYMEGYVNRESNHSPFRYRLNDAVRSAMESVAKQIIEERRETT